MNYLSLCSGIEAATVAWHPLGWEPIAFSEISTFPSHLLAHHYPHVPNLGDMTNYENWKFNTTIDVLIGGTPCQSFSIAGLRKGLDSLNGKLMLTYVEIAARFRPRWLLWENVPGCLSSNNGQDFATLLECLTGRNIPVPKDGWANSGVIEGIPSAYGIAWRVLDSQYFGVAQRRRRVFIVGHLGNHHHAAAVLLERQSLSGNPPPCRSKREETTGAITACAFTGGAGGKPDGAARNHFILDRASFNQGKNAQFDPKISQSETMDTIVSSGPHAVAVGYRMRAFGDYKEDQTASTMKSRDHKDATDLVCQQNPIAFQQNSRDEVRLIGGDGQIAEALMANAGMKQQNYVVHGIQDPCVNNNLAHTLGNNNGQENAIALPIDMRNAMRDPDKNDAQNRQSVGIGKDGDPSHTLTSACVHGVAYGIQGNIIGRSDGNGGNGAGFFEEISGTLTTGDKHAVAYAFDSLASNSMKSKNPDSGCRTVNLAKTLDTSDQNPSKNQGGIGITQGMTVRRLTPIECERLQGFPDNYTLIPEASKNRLKGKELTESITYLINHGFDKATATQLAKNGDSARYHALGNSMAVPVIHWLGNRIEAVEKAISFKTKK